LDIDITCYLRHSLFFFLIIDTLQHFFLGWIDGITFSGTFQQGIKFTEKGISTKMKRSNMRFSGIVFTCIIWSETKWILGQGN